MEQNKKSRLLLAAVILGAIGMILWGCWLFVPFIPATEDGSASASIASSLIQMIFETDWSQVEKGAWARFIAGIGGVGYGVASIWSVTLGPLSLIAAFVLNVLGWLKNDAKKTLVAGILYIISLTIPSAVLYFIGSFKLSKQKA